LPVDVFVEEIAEVTGSARITGLRAEGAQPHEIAGFHLHPVPIEAIDGLALQDIQAVLHHMGLLERNDAAGLEGNDGNVHVVAHVGGVDKSAGRPSPVRVRHRVRCDVLFVGEKGVGRCQSGHGLIGLADPVKPGCPVARVPHAPVACRRDECITALLHAMLDAAVRYRQFAFDDKQDGLGAGIGFRLFAAAARCDFHNILRKRFRKSGHWPRQHPEPGFVPSR